MKTIQLLDFASEETIRGIHTQQRVDLTLTGQIRPHDDRPWHSGSDIPEYEMSVKSKHFSLASGGELNGETPSEWLDDFFHRVASKVFCYVMDDIGYIMNPTEFREFCDNFTELDHDTTNGLPKLRGKRCDRKIKAWFEAHLA